ncbi:uncharacterized protein RHO17_004768 isoform 1-T1 [Thomomys bottae]
MTCHVHWSPRDRMTLQALRPRSASASGWPGSSDQPGEDPRRHHESYQEIPELRIPDDANIFYALKTMDVYHVVLRKYTFPRRTPAKQRSSFSLFHRKRRGSKA